MGLIVFYEIFSNISHLHFQCGKYPGIFCGILSVPQYVVMNVKNVMNLLSFFHPFLIQVEFEFKMTCLAFSF